MIQRNEIVVPDLGALNTFMAELRPCFADGATEVSDGLPALLDALRCLPLERGEPAPQRKFFGESDVHPLLQFIESLRQPFEVIESSGLLGSPWTAAALRSDEVRNASVLKWFLDPRGHHGCGQKLLIDLLQRVGRYLPGGFPEQPSPQCLVSVEESPDGDRTNRIDIEINDPFFYLLVEVKVRAAEQAGQVKRYCRAAARVAGARPWALVFLTRHGAPPTAAEDHIDHIVPLSWRDVAAALRHTARSVPEVPRFLVTSFAAHIDKI